ncbi:hypothetical protein MRX96_015151 [Rhipicephalus microplus]
MHYLPDGVLTGRPCGGTARRKHRAKRGLSDASIASPRGSSRARSQGEIQSGRQMGRRGAARRWPRLNEVNGISAVKSVAACAPTRLVGEQAGMRTAHLHGDTRLKITATPRRWRATIAHGRSLGHASTASEGKRGGSGCGEAMITGINDVSGDELVSKLLDKYQSVFDEDISGHIGPAVQLDLVEGAKPKLVLVEKLRNKFIAGYIIDARDLYTQVRKPVSSKEVTTCSLDDNKW